MERPKLKRDWIGRFVRLRKPMETAAGVFFEAGEVMEVYKYYRGLGLRTTCCCSECSRRYRDRIDKVAIEDVLLLLEDHGIDEADD